MTKKRLTVRLDRRAGEHFHCTLFASGASAGKLCLREEEFEDLVAAFGRSKDNEDPEFEDLAREVGLGRTCAREGGT